MTIVYRPAPGWPATQVVLLLQQNGFTPRVAGSGVTENVTLPGPGASASVEIFVPNDQAIAAGEFLRRWDEYKQIAVRRHAGTFRTHLLISLATGVGLGTATSWALAGFALPAFGSFAIAAILIAIATLVVLGQLTRGKAPDGDFGSRCPKCDYSPAGLTVPRCPECGTQFEEWLLAYTEPAADR